MSIERSVMQVVKSFIAAMHAWETDAERQYGSCSLEQRVRRMEQMFATGEAEAVQTRRLRIFAAHCTPRERISRGGWGTVPQHHPDQERITELRQTADEQANVWTTYTDSQGREMQRRYELHRRNGGWLIDQVYILRDGEEHPEIN